MLRLRRRQALEPAWAAAAADEQQDEPVTPSHPLLEESSDEDGQAQEEPPSFLMHVNRKRAKVDPYVDAFVLLTYGMALLKWHSAMPARCVAAFAGHAALAVLRWAWCSAWPESYIRWRELPAAVATVATLASPIPTVVLLNMARGLGRAVACIQPGGGPPTWLAHMPLLLPLGLVFVSRAQKMAILALGARTRAWLHLPLHAVLLALALSHAPGVCQAVLSQAGLGPGQGLAAVRVWQRAFSALSGFSLLYALPLQPASLPAPTALDAAAQCRCVVAMLQVAAGFLLPAAVHLLSESREYVAFRRRLLAARAQRGAGGGADGAGVGPRVGGGSSRGAGVEGRMARAYVKVYQLAGGRAGMGWEAGLVSAMLLGAVWLGISAEY